MWPIPGRPITSAYGIKGQHWKACLFHTGADIAAPEGTPILAPIAGTIRWRNYGSSFGRSQFAISPSKGQPFADEEFFVAHTIDRLPDGTEVRAGQHIARVGADGNTTGPHGHFERHKGKNVWNCGVMLNPQDMFDWQPSAPPAPAPPPPEDPMSQVIFFTHQGSRYAAYPFAGVYRRIPDPATEKSILNSVGRVGGRVEEWAPGKEVDNPAVFGVLIGE